VNGRPIDARTRGARKSAYADVRGLVRHSWLSVAWTRARGTASSVASAVPVIGGGISHVLDNIHTGDEHQDANGVWVSNATGAPTVQPPNAALQAQIDATNAFNAAEIARIRQQSADLVAKAGIAAAATVGPAGNIYQQLVNTAAANPLLVFAAIGAVLFVLFHASGRKR
jgi:hypothetical protein